MLVNSHLLTVPSLTRGCVAMYRLTGTTANDFGPAGPVVLKNAQLTNDGVDTTGGTMEVPPPYPNHLNYTIAFWMRHNSDPDGGWSRNIIFRAPRAPGLWLYFHNNGVHFTTLFTYETGGQANNQTDEVSDILTKNQWFHIALVSQTLGPFLTRQFLYIDGILRNVVDHPAVTPTPSPGSPLSFGFRVLWRELRLYDRAVSGSEVRMMMQVRSPK